jgi:hypothetical protein
MSRAVRDSQVASQIKKVSIVVASVRLTWPLQPRRLMIARAAGGCKPVFCNDASRRSMISALGRTSPNMR